MKSRFYPELLWVLALLVAAGLGWLVLHNGATRDGHLAVEAALRRAAPADLESITVYPLGPGPTRPFQVQNLAQLSQLLVALQPLRPLAVAESGFQPLLEATVVVRLRAAPAAAGHLHSRSISLRLVSAPQGELAQLAQTNYFYRAAAFSQRLAQLRDSLARR
ncbi:MAG: hypothetical protein EOO59_05925 [Hymenobacter sp.]|nr:MAG: hypothetical protein EOO59_05925 [Hymenobacter sp.]